jgi:hypothetical protein
MRLYEFLERKVIEKNVMFRLVKTANGEPAVAVITHDNNIYVIDASLKNYEMFKKWPKLKAPTTAEIQKTYKTIKLSDGTIVPTVRISADFEI